MAYLYGIPNSYYRELYQEQTRGMSPAEREVFIFRKYLETIPVHIQNGDLIAAWYGYTELPEAVSQFQKKSHEHWVAWEREHSNDPRVIMRERYNYDADGNDFGHIPLHYQAMLQHGTRSYIRRIEQRLSEVESDSPEAAYLTAMKNAVEAGEILSVRFADKAKELAEQTSDMQEKANLLRMEAACRKVPMEPASDFYEAVAAAWAFYSLTCIADNSWVSNSFGSFDQYMYPYYLVSKEKGMQDSEVIALLVELFTKLDDYGGWDCALSLGGVDSEGNDMTNALSYLIVEAEKQSMHRAPLLSVRVNPNTPAKLMDAVVCSKLFEMGQPTFYSEYEYRKAIMSRGIPEKEAAGYMIHTCMQGVIPGAQANASWGIVTNLHLPLELALNGGKPIVGTLPIELHTPPKTEYNSIEEVYDQYKLYFRELFNYLRDLNLQDVREKRMAIPTPWLSAFIDDCIQLGRDRWDGGARYHEVTVENFGFANAADALGAVEELVFKQKKYTVGQMIEAAANNYNGYEDIYHDVMKCPKYGMNIPEADAKARRIMEIVSDICEESWYSKTRFLASLHTLHSDVNFGKRVYAMLDGRLDGEPFNKNAGPANVARCGGPTSVVLSACTLDQIRLSGGQALDMHFGVRNMDDPVKKQKIIALIRTYLSNGGLQMQVNALSSATLKKAYAEPESYKNLIVRIGGHSRYYNDLEDEVKKEFIRRIAIEEGAAG